MQLRAALSNVETRDLKHAGNRGLGVAARLGYLTHGILYGLVGVLALLAVFGHREGRVTGGEGAVQRIGRMDLGEPVLWAIAVGLVCYALWNCVRTLFDPEHRGQSGSSLLHRVGYAVSAVSHGFLAVYAFAAARGKAAGQGGGGDSVAYVLGYPGGRIAVGLAGIAVIVYGLTELYRAIAADVGKEFIGSDLPPARRRLVMQISRLGLFARGVVFPIIGGSLVAVAFGASPGKTRSLGEALREIASQPFGSILLGVVAVGFIAYGIHELLVARYAHLPHPR